MKCQTELLSVLEKAEKHRAASTQNTFVRYLLKIFSKLGLWILKINDKKSNIPTEQE